MTELVIESGRHERNYWRDLWRYRELFYVLSWRDVAVRYKQTAIGLAWALLRPLLTMVIFSVIFGRIAKLSADGGAPYPLMVFSGILPWTFFSTGLSDASGSLIGNANLVSKVYFPRIIVPIATVVVALVDFLVSLVILAGMMIWYHFLPSWRILALPGFVLLCFVASVGPALWVAALNVKYRDFRYVIPFLIQLGLYVSPVGFSSQVVPEKWRFLFALNPTVGVIDGFRWCILGPQSKLYLPEFAISATVIAFFLWFGIRRFRATERSFADMI